MKREQSIKILENLIVTLKVMEPNYVNKEDIEALEFALNNIKNTSTLKGVLVFDMNQCRISNWKSRLEMLENVKVLFDKYLED